MKRRDFIAVLCGAVAWPLAARAATDVPVIGFLSPGSLEADSLRIKGVRRGLAEIGYVEGQNVAIEYRGAQYQYDQLPTLAGDLINRQVSAIVTFGTPAALAAKAATHAIPIVFRPRASSPCLQTRTAPLQGPKRKNRSRQRVLWVWSLVS